MFSKIKKVLVSIALASSLALAPMNVSAVLEVDRLKARPEEVTIMLEMLRHHRGRETHYDRLRRATDVLAHTK